MLDISMDGSFNGARDGFVAKLSSTGSTLLWSTYIGGSGDDECNAIALGADGGVYVTGRTGSSNFPTGNGFDATYGGSHDGFIAKLSSNGMALIWSSFVGGTGFDEPRTLDVRQVAGVTTIVAAGGTYSTDFASPVGTPNPGNLNPFITKMTETTQQGSLVWTRYLGGSSDDQARGVKLAANGDTIIVGSTYSTDFGTFQGFDATLNGVSDGFIARLNSAGSLLFSSYLGGSNGDDLAAVDIDA
jgi:hypothetical protein